MNKLYIIRHAKSSWGDFTEPDFDRPLNERGKRDAPLMATRLNKKDPSITQFISSPAKRASKTCKAFCKAFDFNEDEIIFKHELYHASVATFYKVVSGISAKEHSVALFSHNPGITEFINSLNTAVKVDNMPTCGIYGVSINTESWADFATAEKTCILFDYPKLSENDG